MKSNRIGSVIMPHKYLILIFLLGNAQCDSDDTPGQDDQMSDDLPFFSVTATHLISSRSGNNSMDGQTVDIDQDGDNDLIIAVEFGRNVLLINDGTGKLTDESTTRFPATSHDSEDIAIADFDNDGDIDIVFVSEDDETNEYYQNRGDATFESISDALPVTGTTNAVETADFNNDGFNDLLLGNAGQNFLLINDGAGRFMDETGTRLPANSFTTQDVELGDVDNDGDLDILEGNETFNRLLINDGTGNFTDETNERLPPVNDQTREADFGDIDGDGDQDIFFANVDFGGFGDPQNRLLLNDGSGRFTEATERLPVSDFRTVDGDFFDINNDGSLDIISGNRRNNLENIILINNAGSFEDRTTEFFPDMNVYTFDFQIADFNGDGKADLYLCNFQGEDQLLFAR